GQGRASAPVPRTLAACSRSHRQRGESTAAKLTHLGHDRDAAAVKRSLATLGRTRYGPYLPLGTAVPRRAPTLHAGRAPSLPATRGGVAGRDLLCRHADLLASSESRNDEGRHRRPVLLVLLGRRSRARRAAG